MILDQRKTSILKIISASSIAVNASVLAAQLGVSRQIIVGDIAILRAYGHNIIATNRGYIIPESAESGRYIGKYASKHRSEDIKDELYMIVDKGGKILNVIVDHDLYGELKGQLNLSTRDDIDAFMQKAHDTNSKLLSELKEGVHLHTISCENKETFDRIIKSLMESSFIYIDNL